MKVAIVCDTNLPDLNGVVNTLKRMEDGFEKINLEYMVISPGNPEENDDKHHYFKAAPFLLYGKINFAFILLGDFIKAIEPFNPDVIHIMTEGPIGFQARRYAKDNEIPFVASYTTDIPSYSKYYTKDLLTPIVNMYLKNFHQDAYTNLVPSQYSLDQLDEMGVTNNTKWQRGIDCTSFYPLKDKKINDRKKLLFVGRVALEKNIQVLIEMAEILNSENYDFELNIVGNGPIFDQLVSQNTSNVNLLGEKRGEELYQIYREADAFVFASEYETFGNVVLESFASGVPVIGAFKGGVRENLQDGVNGLAIHDTNPRNFADSVKLIFGDEDKYFEMSKNAREFALERSWEKLIKELVSNYESAYKSKQMEKAS